MLDTVKLRSPFLAEDLAGEIERSCVRRSAEHLGTGELLYQLTTGDLEGDYDHRVRVMVRWDEVVQELRQRVEASTGRKVSSSVQVRRRCPPYLELEGSIHKAMLGHNVAGGPESLREPCEWLCEDVGRRLGVELPGGSEWFLRRVDWAECYELPDVAAVEEYMWGLNAVEYPRRSVARYGRESIFAGGRTTAVKAYHKGPELAKHDRRRLQSVLNPGEYEQLQHHAYRVLRWEVTIKAKKLDENRDEKPRVGEISVEDLRDLHHREVRRLVREGEADVKTVRKQKAVRDRLLDHYDSRKAGILLGTWHQLVTLGEHETRRHIASRTYRRHKKDLLDAGVSWIGADVVVMPSRSSLPEDFTVGANSPYRLAGEHPTVAAKLSPYRAA